MRKITALLIALALMLMYTPALAAGANSVTHDFGDFTLTYPEDMILEVKTPGGIPIWMVRFLSEHKIYQTSFSKYGTAYQQWLMDGKKTGGLLYA